MVVRRTRRGARLFLLAVITAGSLAAAGPADASIDVNVDGDTLYIDGTDAKNSISVAKGNAAGTEWDVADSADFAVPTPGDGCPVDPGTAHVTCANAGITRIAFDTLGEDDQVTIFAGVNPEFLTADLGSGDDFLADQRTVGDAAVGLGEGDDRTLFEIADGQVEVFGGPGDDYVRGTGGNDVLHGDAGADQLYGYEGDDRIDAGDGDDRVTAAEGDDDVFGGGGDDALGGGAGNDTVTGGPGEDRVGSDHYPYILTDPFNAFILQSPQGDDTLDLFDGEPDEVRCGGGYDTAAIDDLDYEAEKEDANCEEYIVDTDPGDGGGGGGNPSGGGSTTTTSTTTGGGADAPAPSSSALLVRDGTRATQRIAKVLKAGVAASLTASGPGTWKVRLLSGRKVLGAATKKVAAAGTVTARVKLNRAGRKRLKRARKVKLTLRSTFTDALGRTATTTRKVTLKR